MGLIRVRPPIPARVEIKKTRTVVIGGPAYNMQCSTKHADTVAYLLGGFQSIGWKVALWHRHNSVLVENRDTMLRECVNRGADIFISIDSDTYLEEESAKNSIGEVLQTANDLAEWDELLDYNPHCAVAPVRQRNGQWNVAGLDGKKIKKLPDSAISIPDEAQWTAFAFAIFRCKAYRKWCESEFPLFNFKFDKTRPEEDRWVGEDSYHSLMITQNGGRIIVNPKIVTGHDV